MGRPDIICTPHLGASTKEAQEEVAYEIAEAVISALNVGARAGWSKPRPLQSVPSGPCGAHAFGPPTPP